MPQGQGYYTPEQFVGLARQVYPEAFQGWSDEEVLEAALNEWPQYREQVLMPGQAPAPDQRPPGEGPGGPQGRTQISAAEPQGEGFLAGLSQWLNRTPGPGPNLQNPTNAGMAGVPGVQAPQEDSPDILGGAQEFGSGLANALPLRVAGANLALGAPGQNPRAEELSLRAFEELSPQTGPAEAGDAVADLLTFALIDKGLAGPIGKLASRLPRGMRFAPRAVYEGEANRLATKAAIDPMGETSAPDLSAALGYSAGIAGPGLSRLTSRATPEVGAFGRTAEQTAEKADRLRGRAEQQLGRVMQPQGAAARRELFTAAGDDRGRILRRVLATMGGDVRSSNLADLVEKLRKRSQLHGGQVEELVGQLTEKDRIDLADYLDQLKSLRSKTTAQFDQGPGRQSEVQFTPEFASNIENEIAWVTNLLRNEAGFGRGEGPLLSREGRRFFNAPGYQPLTQPRRGQVGTPDPNRPIEPLFSGRQMTADSQTGQPLRPQDINVSAESSPGNTLGSGVYATPSGTRAGGYTGLEAGQPGSGIFPRQLNPDLAVDEIPEMWRARVRSARGVSKADKEVLLSMDPHNMTSEQVTAVEKLGIPMNDLYPLFIEEGTSPGVMMMAGRTRGVFNIDRGQTNFHQIGKILEGVPGEVKTKVARAVAEAQKRGQNTLSNRRLWNLLRQDLGEDGASQALQSGGYSTLRAEAGPNTVGVDSPRGRAGAYEVNFPDPNDLRSINDPAFYARRDAQGNPVYPTDIPAPAGVKARRDADQRFGTPEARQKARDNPFSPDGLVWKRRKAIAEELGKNNPDLAKVNRLFSDFQTAYDQSVEAYVEQQARQGSRTGEVLALAGTGRGAFSWLSGAAAGGAAGGGPGAVIGAVLPLLFIRMAESPYTRTRLAWFWNQYADHMMKGDVDKAAGLVSSMLQATGTAVPALSTPPSSEDFDRQIRSLQAQQGIPQDDQ